MTETPVIGDPNFVATSLKGPTLMQGIAKVKDQIHTRRKSQYFTALTSQVKAKRNRVAKTAGQILMYMVNFSILHARSMVIQLSIQQELGMEIADI